MWKKMASVQLIALIAAAVLATVFSLIFVFPIGDKMYLGPDEDGRIPCGPKVSGVQPTCASGMTCWASDSDTCPPKKPSKGKVCCGPGQKPDSVLGNWFCIEDCKAPKTLKCGMICCNPDTENCKLQRPFPGTAPNTGVGYCMKKDQTSCDTSKGETPCPNVSPFSAVMSCCAINQVCTMGTVTVGTPPFGVPKVTSDPVYVCLINKTYNGPGYTNGCPTGESVCSGTKPTNEGDVMTICCPKDKCNVDIDNGQPYCTPPASS